MKAIYDEDIDYLEVMAADGRKALGERRSDALTLFFAEKSHELVGFALEGATSRLAELDAVSNKMRLAGLVRLARGLMHLTQEELAAKINIGGRTLQRIESGEGNLTFDNMVSLAKIAPKAVDFSLVLKQTRERGLGVG